MPFKSGEGRPPINISESEIRYAMSNTQSCMAAARFLNVSYDSFRKYSGLYKDKETGQIITTTSSSNRRALQEQLKSAIEQRSQISIKLEQATDSINSIEVKSLTVETESDLAGELGPLKYLSELTEVPMNRIINYLLLIIIFVFDPLAISLVIAANFMFNQLKDKVKTEITRAICSTNLNRFGIE